MNGSVDSHSLFPPGPLRGLLFVLVSGVVGLVSFARGGRRERGGSR